MFWFVLRRNWWKITKTLLLGGTLLFAGFCGYVFFALTNNVYNDWWFDEAIWKSQLEKSKTLQIISVCDSKRIYMADDLQRRVLKKGMTRQKVLALLGRPNAQNAAYSKISLAYYLGCDSDVVVYEIEFDKHQKVINSSRHSPFYECCRRRGYRCPD